MNQRRKIDWHTEKGKRSAGSTKTFWINNSEHEHEKKNIKNLEGGASLVCVLKVKGGEEWLQSEERVMKEGRAALQAEKEDNYTDWSCSVQVYWLMELTMFYFGKWFKFVEKRNNSSENRCSLCVAFSPFINSDLIEAAFQRIQEFLSFKSEKCWLDIVESKMGLM